MSEDQHPDAPPPRRRRRWARALGAVALLLLAVLGIAWWQRVQIADGFVARELARRGVPARYVVKDIGFFRQRIEQVSIGDPKAPDLIAEWVDIDTGFTLGGPVVTGVRAGPLRMRGTLEGGRLSLGALDRLLPPPSGKPISLPELHVDLEDARMALATPQGDVALVLTGRGRLDDGFAGRLKAQALRLDLGGCVVRRLAGDVAIRVARRAPMLRGPVRAQAVACGDALAWEPAAELTVALDEAFTRWRGEARLGIASLQTADALAEPLGGTVAFEGSAARTTGSVDLTAGRLAAMDASGADVQVAGRYAVGGAGARFEGSVTSPDAALGPGVREMLAGIAKGGQGTPVGPLLAQLARAASAASQGGRLEAALAVEAAGRVGSVRIARARFAAASGAQALLEGEEGVLIRWPGGPTLNGTLTLQGGGMPHATVRLAQAQPGAPISGTAMMLPYAAGGARLELATVRFTAAADGVTRVSTRATLSGPVADGRIDRLVMPIDGRWDGAGLVLNPMCAPVAFARLQVSSLVLDATRLNVCPVGAALLGLRGGAVSGGARVANVRLGGRIGSSPLALSAATGSFDFARQGFMLSNVATRIGSESVTRLDVARLDGRIASGSVAGDFAGAGGQIGSVPLLLSDGAGRWSLAGGRLELAGAMRVADTAPSPRFHPLVSDDVRLSLADSRIEARGRLTTPGGVAVTDVTLTHDLSRSTGSAVLDVPGIRFAEEGFQPSDLTRLTFGVIAAVKGQVSGQGRIRWDSDGVTSDGVFRTSGTDLAAAFGPVTGLSTEIRFADLLAMRSEPGQVATVGELNPGIPVDNGTIRYQLLDAQRVRVEGGRWPFAGGVLELEPALLDFGQAQEKRMTFRLTGVDAALFLQEMEYKNLNATGIFDGVLPIVFDARGGRIEGGHLKARAGGSIAYVGEVSQKDLGFWGNLAFQALRSLDYRNLDLDMNGSLAGDMVTEIRFAGVSQGDGAKSNFVIRRLQRLPFVFNVTVRAPFRQLLESVQSYYDPSRLIERNLPALLEEQQRQRQQQNIQPSESETVP